MPTRAWLPTAAVVVTMVLWASAFVAIRHLGDDFSPTAMSLGRMLVATVALTAVVSRRPRHRVARGDWWRLLVIGVLWYAVYHVALNAGELRVDAGTAAMLLQASPVMLAVAAALFLSEPFTRNLALGLALAFGGVVLISAAGTPEGNRDVLGVLLCLVAALVYVVSVVVQKPLLSRLPALQLTWLACGMGTAVQLPFLPTLVTQVAAAPVSSVWWLAYLGLFPTAIAFTTYGYALTHMPAGRLGVTTYLVPPITIALGWVFLGEVPPTLAYVGGALALLGVAVARRTPRPAPAAVSV